MMGCGVVSSAGGWIAVEFRAVLEVGSRQDGMPLNGVGPVGRGGGLAELSGHLDFVTSKCYPVAKMGM